MCQFHQVPRDDFIFNYLVHQKGKMMAQNSFFCQQYNNVLLDNIGGWLFDGKGEMLEKIFDVIIGGKVFFLHFGSLLRDV
jgi:hypothetical protein